MFPICGEEDLYNPDTIVDYEFFIDFNRVPKLHQRDDDYPIIDPIRNGSEPLFYL